MEKKEGKRIKKAPEADVKTSLNTKFDAESIHFAGLPCVEDMSPVAGASYTYRMENVTCNKCLDIQKSK